MILDFNIKNQQLSKHRNQNDLFVAADSKKYLVARFNFQTKDWKDGLKCALFTHQGKTYKRLLGTDGLASNECYVSPEVIQAPGFTVSCCCDGEGLITTNKVEVGVEESGYTEHIINQDATPTVMEQMNDLMKKYALICNSILLDCQQIQENITNQTKEDK